MSFGPLFDAFDVTRSTLGDGALRTLNAPIRFALTGQPGFEAQLALERPEAGDKAASAGLLALLAG